MIVMRVKKPMIRQTIADTISNFVTFSFSIFGSTNLTSASSTVGTYSNPLTSSNMLGSALLIAFVKNGLNSFRSAI